MGTERTRAPERRVGMIGDEEAVSPGEEKGAKG